MTTTTIDGKEYEITVSSKLDDGRKIMTLVEVPKKPAPLNGWALVSNKTGRLEAGNAFKPPLEAILRTDALFRDCRLARIVEVPEDARRVWVVMDKSGDTCGTRKFKHDAESLLKDVHKGGRYGPYTLHEFVEVGEVKV
jgi:hypothetical protein